MKIVICNIPMKSELFELHPVDGISLNGKPLIANYAINVELAKILIKNEEMHIIFLKSHGGDDCTDENIIKFKDELKLISQEKNLDIRTTYEEIDVPFTFAKDITATVFRNIIGSIKKITDKYDNVSLYADVTFNSKLLPMTVFCAFNFAEKYLNVDVKKIMYGKVEFIERIPIKETAAVFNITMLYCLNSLTNSIDCDSPETALKVIDDFINL